MPLFLITLKALSNKLVKDLVSFTLYTTFCSVTNLRDICISSSFTTKWRKLGKILYPLDTITTLFLRCSMNTTA